MFGKRRIGIALCGGAARALSHIGVLQVLESGRKAAIEKIPEIKRKLRIR